MLGGIVFLLFAVSTLVAVLWYVIGDQHAGNTIASEARLTRKQLDAWFAHLQFSHKMATWVYYMSNRLFYAARRYG